MNILSDQTCYEADVKQVMNVVFTSMKSGDLLMVQKKGEQYQVKLVEGLKVD